MSRIMEYYLTGDTHVHLWELSITRAEKQSSQVYCVIYPFHTQGLVSIISTLLKNNDYRETLRKSAEGIVTPYV